MCDYGRLADEMYDELWRDGMRDEVALTRALDVMPTALSTIRQGVERLRTAKMAHETSEKQGHAAITVDGA